MSHSLYFSAGKSQKLKKGHKLIYNSFIVLFRDISE